LLCFVVLPCPSTCEVSPRCTVQYPPPFKGVRVLVVLLGRKWAVHIRRYQGKELLNSINSNLRIY
jgi:hypothetical protein